MTRFTLLASLAGVAAGTKYDAITNVIQQLEKMAEDGAVGLQEEKVTYTKFKTWSDNMMETLDKDIKRNELDQATAMAAKEEAATARDNAQATIEASNKSIKSKTLTMKANKETMEKQNAEHVENQENTSNGIMACENAIGALKAMTNLSAASFLQIQSKIKSFSTKKSSSPDTTKALIQELKKVMDPFKNPTMFAQDGPTYVRELKSEADGSGLPDIVKMIEDLMSEFEDEREANAKTHRENVNKFERTKADLADAIKNLKETVDDQSAVAAEQEAIRAAEEKNEADATKELDENTKLRTNLSDERDSKAASYKKSQSDREGEIVAIKKAVEVLSDLDLNKHLGDAQTVSFIQLSRSRSSDPVELANMLRENARRLHSQSLAQVAMSLEENGPGPFDKIIGMIETMLTDLQSQADKEKAHHQKCTEKYDQLDRDNERMSSDLKKFKANLGTLKARVQEGDTKIKESEADLESTTTELAEATDVRNKEASENNIIITESNEGLKAVESAIKTLQDYYASIAGNEGYKASMGQDDEFRNLESKQEFQRGDYTGQEGSGVIAILEVVKADAEQLIGDKTDYETKAKEQYTILSEDLNAKKLALETSITGLKLAFIKNTNLAEEQSKAIKDKTQELDMNAKDRTATDKVCQVQGVSFEERAAARAEEIQSLNEAYKILSDGI